MCDREGKGGAARERGCSVCVNVFACNCGEKWSVD